MSEKDTQKQSPDDLSAFGEKIKQARNAGETRRLWGKDFDKPPQSALGLAFRVSVELVSALVVGLAIGWALDQWFDTGPILMVVFLILGFAAGLMNVYRVAKGMTGTVGYKENTEISEADDAEGNPKRGKD